MSDRFLSASTLATLIISIVLSPHHLLAGQSESTDPTVKAAATRPVTPDIERLIRQLGDSSFATRERATRQLEQLGRTAKPALIHALQDRDAEIRHRVRRVLIAVLRDDFEHRLAAFAADMDGQEIHDLPGWQLYQDQVGGDAVGRRVYLESVRAEPILLESIEQEENYATAALKSRSTTLYNDYIRNPMFRGVDGAAQAGKGSVAALLLAAANPRLKLDDHTSTKIYQLVQHAGLRQQLDAGDRQQPLRRLVGSFIRRTADSALAYQTIWLAMQHNLREGLVPAELIVQRRERHPYMLQNAILCIGKLGDKGHLQMLEPMLEDATAVDGRVANATRPQVRDVALAVSIHLSGQNPKDFGFAKVQKNTHTLFQSNTLAFASEQMRQAAFSKWQSWQQRDNQESSSPQQQ